MRKILMTTVAALTLVAGTAHAEQAEGKIEQIDKIAGTIMVNGDVYRVTDNTTAGDTLEDLKEGDTVQIQYKLEEGGDEDQYFDALSVDKVE